MFFKRKRNRLLIYSSVILIVIAVCVFYKENALSSSSERKIVTGLKKELVHEQSEMEAVMTGESSDSTIEDPYVKVDPYGKSPLSALVIFHTDKAAKVSFTVKGKDSDADISETIEGYETDHEIPILGLYADYENTVEITVTNEDGEVATKELSIQTEALPDAFPTVEIESANQENMEFVKNGLTFVVPSTKYAYGFDVNGDIRWYGSGYNSHVFQELENGHILFLGKDSNDGDSYNTLMEMDYIGKIYYAYYISDDLSVKETEDSWSTVVHHDAIELPSGNFLLTINDGSKYIEDTMIELNRTTGTVEKVIDLKEILPKSFYKKYSSTKKEDGSIDWFHQNSVVYDESDDSIIISGRSQDTVMKLDYETKEIIWILADEEGWPSDYEQYLLKPTGENFKYPAAQHAAVVLPDKDGNDETVDLLLYDNNKVITRGDESLSGQYSAATQYRINESTKEVELIWTFGEELGEDYYTMIVGSAKYLEGTGNRLINFGYRLGGTQSSIVEVTDDENAEVVFEASIKDFPYGAWAYRAQRLALYPENYSFSMQ